MNSDRILIASILCFGLGLSVIFGYCHGTAGFGVTYPFQGTSLQLSLTTTGLPAILGLILTVAGLAAVLYVFTTAVIRQAQTYLSIR